MDDAVRTYLDAADPANLPLWERVAGVVREVAPTAELGLSYGVPTFRVGRGRFHVGLWPHGVSLYGWRADDDGGFLARHPRLRTGRGTIRMSAADAAGVTDDELRGLVRGALRPGARG
ncbi:hypothetical protein GCM10027047_11760 [Rhodococcus aerolatus]